MSIIRCEHCERSVDTDLKPAYEICEQCADSLTADWALAEHLDKTVAVAADAVNRANQAEAINADLLEALEAIAKPRTGVDIFDMTDKQAAGYWYATTQEARNKARAAIAKAKGG